MCEFIEFYHFLSNFAYETTPGNIFKRYIGIRFDVNIMIEKENLSIRINGELRDFSAPWVMGIVNVTTDSFYSGSRTFDVQSLEARVRNIIACGADCFDVGGYSSRPGCEDISAAEEYSRLAVALECIRKIDESAVISVDTFRTDVARRCVEEWGVQIINDIGGGTLDEEMFPAVADLRVAYVLMHMRGTPLTMTRLTDYKDVTAEVITDLAFKLDKLHQLGVADVIIDPGFGFAKTIEQNYTLLRELGEFCKIGCPVLAGLSRKSMIYKLLNDCCGDLIVGGCTPTESLNGTTALNMAALMNGADILRVHDVKEARECVALYEALCGK